MAYLEIREGDSVRQLKLLETMTIGRKSSTSDPDISFTEIFVSRRHGILQQTGRGLFYTDMKSTNGSWLNGVKLPPNAPVLLSDGDSIMFCNSKDSSAANAFVI
ncbi:MAG: FHA domain-containing protein, partial [Lachnospiraceae bacterium]|nr:FHA domain-containing protein [Lachnospiraceae bacterium]